MSDTEFQQVTRMNTEYFHTTSLNIHFSVNYYFDDEEFENW